MVSVLNSVLREDYDILVRVGGDEFYIIVPGASIEEAKLIRRKIKAKFKSTPFKTNGTVLSIGTSVGLATSHKKNGQQRNVRTVFDLADRILYTDKSVKN
jgi:diguanylate cyclase (GGDEF)-like protein